MDLTHVISATCSVITMFFDLSTSTRRRVRLRGMLNSGERLIAITWWNWKTRDSKSYDFVYFRLPDYRKSFMVVNNDRFLLDLSRVYVAQIMEQFHVLVRLTTVLGNQYGYNFKSPGSNFCEPDLVSEQKHDIYIANRRYIFRLLNTALITSF